MRSGPIGVFDSGVGGLTVLRELNRVLPRESTIYLGDSKRIPYGGLPAETIVRYTLSCLDHLYAIGVKALVLACNSATSAALEAARTRYDVPVMGVIEPTARDVAARSSGKVGILATEATVRSRAYARAIAAGNPDLEVLQQPCPLLADLVEAGQFRDVGAEELLRQFLDPLREEGVSTLVLGCTHFPFFRRSIERLMGPSVRVVECGPPVADALRHHMTIGELEEATNGVAFRRMMTTGSAEAFRRVASQLWPGECLEIEEVTIEVINEQLRLQTA
jgi:glutamate racemase